MRAATDWIGKHGWRESAETTELKSIEARWLGAGIGWSAAWDCPAVGVTLSVLKMASMACVQSRLSVCNIVINRRSCN